MRWPWRKKPPLHRWEENLVYNLRNDPCYRCEVCGFLLPLMHLIEVFKITSFHIDLKDVLPCEGRDSSVVVSEDPCSEVVPI